MTFEQWWEREMPESKMSNELRLIAPLVKMLCAAVWNAAIGEVSKYVEQCERENQSIEQENIAALFLVKIS